MDKCFENYCQVIDQLGYLRGRKRVISLYKKVDYKKKKRVIINFRKNNVREMLYKYGKLFGLVANDVYVVIIVVNIDY